MPTYQYHCDGCGHSFEQLQSITAKKLRKCPHCGKFQLHRLIGTGSGIIFKGSGFYETDYKRAKKGPPPKSCPNNCENKATCPAATKTKD
jgi:putative FmdB family regulatory protein